MTGSQQDLTTSFLHQHSESMKDVGKILYFLSFAVMGALGSGQLDYMPSIFLAFSLLFLFFAYGFLFLHSQFEAAGIQYDGAYRYADESDPVGRLTSHFDNKSRLSAYLLIFLVFGSSGLLFCGLIDQFIESTIIPALPETLIVAMLVGGFFALLSIWVDMYLALGKSLEDFQELDEGKV